ncbi:SUMF1/EgtB/PvdO family nonheme iron enzyme [Nannocystis sp. bb15-2]|uniref:SUMF1/EgtB/PvdO family nonheme iron enzyme n=2 Tax=Nannocystis bainbridge TaxID=2995303 RepID=A0ABT5E987_9BACT|nr:SUMF1/EgtB/PvdO family nonheme iron enzyme [Nannocystis bainbridge]
MADLLCSIFAKDELRRFMMLHYKEIHDGIRWEDSHLVLTAEIAAAFERHGHIDDASLKAALKAERPRRGRDIAELRSARRWLPAVMLGAMGLGGVVMYEQGLLGGRAIDPESMVLPGEAVVTAEEAAKPPAPCPEDMVLVVPDPRLYRGERSFCLDVHEVSRGRYGLTCPPVRHGGVHDQLDATYAQHCDPAVPDPRWSDYPVVQITAAEARIFCEQQGRRLPTASERKIAAVMDIDYRRVGEFIKLMNLCGAECLKSANVPPFVFKHEDAFSHLAPVGSFRDWFPSRLGVADLFGNAQEFVLRGDGAIACGGSWLSYDKKFLAPDRCDDETTKVLDHKRMPDVGFRCASDLAVEDAS